MWLRPASLLGIITSCSTTGATAACPGTAPGASRQLPDGPFATTDGVIWEKTGSTYQLNWQDVNIELDFRAASDQPTTVITNTFLVSTNVAHGDVNFYTPPTPDGAYPGYWFGSGTVPDLLSPYAMNLGGNQEYYLPSSLTDPVPAQFELYFWQGDETSYAAAAAAGENVGCSGWFKAGPMASDNSPVPSTTFEYMPSVILQPMLPGDANGDGTVDINDLTIVLANYGQTGMTWSQGEFTGDGTVDINDLTIVLAHYGQSVGSFAAGTAAVPEPTALVLIGLGGLGMLGFVWRRQKPGA